MKSFLLLFFLVTIHTCFAQDYIVKKDGTKIEAKVVEITPTTIRYKLFTQPDGPLRNIAIVDVKEIIYEDGQFDNFEDYEPKKAAPTPSEDVPRGRTYDSDKDPYLDRGFFVDGLIGMGSRETYDYYYDYVSGFGYYSKANELSLAIGMRLGLKWYFGQREMWRPGFQLTFIRYNAYIVLDEPETIFSGTKNFSIGNLGFCNAFKFNDNLGMEANFIVGPNMLIDPRNSDFNLGLNFNPTVKIRFNKFALGLDYSRIQGLTGEINPFGNYTSMNTFSLSIGVKM